jgi:2-succinyl-6-hydroxy-2,4-cyclohexadiene-1-carboxylate synthase
VTAPLRAVLLHGFLGDASAWSEAVAPLADRLRPVVIDLPGHAGRAPPSDLESVFTEVERWLQPGDVLIGYSQGARVALAVAARGRVPLAGLVLESGTAGIADPAARQARSKADHAAAARLRRDGLTAFVDGWEGLPVLAGLRDLPASARAALRARRLAHDPEGVARALEVYGQGAMPDLWPSLPDLDVPVLVLSGERDPTYREIAGRLCAALPRARAVVIPAAGHTPHLEQPDAWRAAVSAFLAGLS